LTTPAALPVRSFYHWRHRCHGDWLLNKKPTSPTVDSLYEVLLSLTLSGSKTETTTMIIYPIIQLECSKLTPHSCSYMCPTAHATTMKAKCTLSSCVNRRLAEACLFCFLAVLDPRVGHTMDVLSAPFISILCHSDWLFLSTTWCCLFRPCVVFLAWHCSLHYFFLQAISLVSSWYDHSMLASLLWQCLTVPSLFQLRTEPTHFFSLLSTKRAESVSVLPSQRPQDVFLHPFWCPAFTAVRGYRPY